MPKHTFDQLSPSKKERVLTAAAQLFAERGFARTDMAEVAVRAGVAKGSLYNYFESKDDLYLHVCRDGLERSRQAVYDGLEPEWDVFRQIDHIFRQGVSFALTRPEYIRLYLNISAAGGDRFADELTLEVERHTADYLKKIITDGIHCGLVRPNLDVNMAAFLINSLYIMFVISLVSGHYRIRMKGYLKIEGELNELTIEGRLQMVIDLIQNVLRP
jgi:TetR/AcrR family transcriptional regulator